MARITIPIGMVFLLFLAACSSTTPMDIPKVSHSAPESATMAQIQDAIHKAGAGLGWGMKPVGEGRMEGRLAVRSHVAAIGIAFDRKTFSITYKDSIDLGYNGTTIHKKYYGWIANLRKAIIEEVSSL